MSQQTCFNKEIKPDWEEFLSCIKSEKTPARVHFIELFLDAEIQDEICERFNLTSDFSGHDADFLLKKQVALQRFLGYDYVRCGLDDIGMPLIKFHSAADTADLKHEKGRNFVDQGNGPVTTWKEFESYPWPDPEESPTTKLEWYDKNLPDDMCIIGGGGFGHFYEYLSSLMGYETLCFTLFENRELVKAIADKLGEIYRKMAKIMLSFDRTKALWGSDDMGFRSGTLISPDDLREFVLPGHKLMAEMAHAAGRPYLLHSCGNLKEIMNDLVDDVKMDGKHSFEDTIENIIDFKNDYNGKVAALGGIDVDFLCRGDENEIRARVKSTVEACHPGGGFCLGTGNSVANYIPVANYLTMLDEGRKFSL